MKMIRKPIYFNKISKIYDIIYNDLNYESKTNWVHKFVLKNKLRKKVLDIACGTGKNLYYFEKLGYITYGLDISEGMLNEAKKRLSKTKLIRSSFSDISLNEKFPLITCFFNSLLYNKTKNDMKKTFLNIYNLLEKNGLFVFDLFLAEKPKKILNVSEYKQNNHYVSRTFIGIPRGDKFFATWVYVHFDGNKTEIIKENVVKGMFSYKDILNIIQSIGFRVIYKGRGYWNKKSELTVFVLKK